MNNEKRTIFARAMRHERFNSVFVAWSDHTWEEFIIESEWERSDHVKCHYKVKEGFNPFKASRCGMTREEFLKYYRENVKIVMEEES